jgi:4-phytase/acid phosphatase
MRPSQLLEILSVITDLPRRALRRAALLAALLACLPSAALSQEPGGGEELERVVIVMRHGVRAAMSSREELGRYSARQWPDFAVPAGHLTANGGRAVTLLGEWYRRRYQAAGLLAEGDCSAWYHANHYQRTEATAAALAKGLTPGCANPVHQAPAAPDPLFDAPLTPLAPADPARILAALSGRIGGDLTQWDARQRPALERFEALLLQCRNIPCDAQERTGVELRLGDTPVRMALDEKGDLVLTSPALQVAGIAESLMMAYADGLDFAGWEGVDAATVGDVMAVHGAGIDLRVRTPEVGRQTSSYLAMRLLATLQRDTRQPVLADPVGDGEKVVILSGHDGTVAMLAGLLGLEWQIASYAPGQVSPGGALVFERWRRSDGERAVRVYYIAQTLGQLRHLTPLDGEVSPEIAPIFVPGCGGADLSCSLSGFTGRVLAAVGG